MLTAVLKHSLFVQIGVEIHMSPSVSNKKSNYINLLKTIKKFRSWGFHLLSFAPNMLISKFKEADRKYHSYFDVLFARL